MRQNLFLELEKTLRMESKYCTEDGILIKNAIVEAALALHPDLLHLILGNDGLKQHFFSDVDGILVFDKVKFQKFVMNKRFLPDSYTTYKNKVGLTNEDGDYIADSREVVLSWPYKDCVLEGGQTKEDTKRNEIFYNEILAPDEINRLTEPKVLTHFLRYSENGVNHVKELDSDENYIIRGNNLLALSSLTRIFSEKVKMVFIDPPYNTGNDSFGYNDSFKHSTWLTFMLNRLKLAHKLLSADGTLCLMIDHNELPYCMAVVDTIFGKQNLRNIITVKRGSVTGAKVINPGVVNLSDYLVIYSKSSAWKPNRVYKAKDRDNRYNLYIDNYDDSYERWYTIPVVNAFAESLGIKKSSIKKVLGSEYESKLDDFVISNAHRIVQFATLDDNNISQQARGLKIESINNPEKVYLMERPGKNPYYVLNGKLILFAKDRLIEVDGKMSFSEPVSDIWDDVLPNDLHNEGGVIFKKGKKPEKLLLRVIELCSSKGDLVLDYHLGSGTTAAVALKSKRRFIGIEQLDYGQNDSVKRLQNVIGKKRNEEILDYDTRGVSTTVNWTGGGSFVYCELAKANERFSEEIKAATTDEQIQKIWESMQETGFLSWKIDPKAIAKGVNDFTALSLDDKKRFLMECLDKNLLYIPFSEINNAEFKVSEEDKKLNAQFYSRS